MQTEQTVETDQPGQDILQMDNYLIRAETAKRLLNYIIDLISFYAVFFVFGIILAIVEPDVVNGIAEAEGFGLVDRVITLAFYGLYMGTIEAIFKGKSLGKYFSKTRAVNLDGSQITTSTAFIRGFSRAVPFAVFSAFGSPCNPWQDKWSDTMVIDEKLSTIQ